MPDPESYVYTAQTTRLYLDGVWMDSVQQLRGAGGERMTAESYFGSRSATPNSLGFLDSFRRSGGGQLAIGF
jgi:hypothetical protein